MIRLARSGRRRGHDYTRAAGPDRARVGSAGPPLAPGRFTRGWQAEAILGARFDGGAVRAPGGVTVSGDPGELFDRAVQARQQGDWRTVILLCGQVLARDPRDPGAVALLTQARDALRQRRIGAATVVEEQPPPPSPTAEAASTPADSAEQASPPPERPPSPEPQPSAEQPADLPAVAPVPPEELPAAPLAAAPAPPEERPAPPEPGPAPLPVAQQPAVEVDQPAVSTTAPPPASAPAEERSVDWTPPVPRPSQAVAMPRTATRPRARDAATSPPAAPHPAARSRPYWRLALLSVLAVAVLLVVLLAGPWRDGQTSGLGTAQTSDGRDRTGNQSVASQVTPPLPSPTPAQTAAELFARCEEASAAGNWTEALAACEGVRDQDPNYPGLARALATIYLRLAQEKLAQGATPAAQELLERALEYVEKGGVAQPPDAAAAQQRALAQAYQEGQAALASGDWPTAASKLQEVFDAAPDYGAGATDGGVRKDLAAALLGWGDSLLAAGDYSAAQQRCEQALDLVPTSAEAAACQNAAVAALVAPSPGPAAAGVPGRPVFQPRYPERPKEPQALPSPQQAARY